MKRWILLSFMPIIASCNLNTGNTVAIGENAKAENTIGGPVDIKGEIKEPVVAVGPGASATKGKIPTLADELASAEQGGADQPATAPESKLEDKKDPKPEAD